MKRKFDAYLLRPFAKRVQNWIVDQYTARNFKVVVVSVGMGNCWYEEMLTSADKVGGSKKGKNMQT
jgi:hypothetical protein